MRHSKLQVSLLVPHSTSPTSCQWVGSCEGRSTKDVVGVSTWRGSFEGLFVRCPGDGRVGPAYNLTRRETLKIVINEYLDILSPEPEPCPALVKLK